MRAVLLVLTAALVRLQLSRCQSCPEPTTASLADVISQVIQSGDATTDPVITIANFEVVCRAFSREEDLLRGVSVVVEYTCTDHANCPMGTVTEQIESGCSSGSWNNNVGGVTASSHIRTTAPIATLSTTARDDCSFCFSDLLAADAGVTTDPVTHCVVCDSECDEGLMRCFDIGAGDCCNYYNSGTCVAECPSPFVENSDSICVCPEGLTGSNCEIVVTCPELVPPLNGAIDLINRTFNTVVTYSCSEGYILAGDSTRTCLGTGVWSGSDPTCTVVDCGELMAPENGAVGTSPDTTFTSTATYSCNDGYTLEGVTTRTCLASGSWSGTAPTCTVVDCGNLLAPSNGDVMLSDTTFTSTATYSCNDGYTLEGVTTRTCLASGSWSDSAPTCTVVDCEDLLAPSNGDVMVSTTVFGSTATYSCNDGYTLEGVTTRTCLANGSWSESAPTCTVVDCGNLLAPSNGDVMVSTTEFGSTVTYSCNDGYTLEGVTTRTCLASGSWSGTAPTCTVVDCGNLLAPSNGDVMLSGTTFTSTATYSCNDGYTLEGVTTRTCLASGSWSDSAPTCQPHTLGGSCSLISSTDLERVLSSYISEQSCLSPPCAPVIITIDDMYINCLSSGPTHGTYSHTTVTVNYRTSGVSASFLAQADIGCSSITNSWEASVLRSLASSVGQVFASGSGTTEAETKTSCSACLSPQLAAALGMTSDSIYHCVGCDAVCSTSGSGLCYGPTASDCCSYHTSDGACVGACGSRETFDSEWQCVCAGSWRETDCTVCDLTCGNGGTPDLSECIACDCPTGYTGTLCEEDFDECSNSDTCSYGDCTNTIGSYTCSCFSGYTGQNCDSNIDECVEGTHECVNGARCVDAVPGYQCQCVDGTGGSRCEECTLPGCESCSIRERDGTVLCSKCLQGYYLTVQGQCERSCEAANCLACVTSSSTKCEICQSGYSITADGQCTIIRGTNPTTSIREDVSDDPRGGGNGIDLTDFQIAAIIAGVIIFFILLLTLLTCIFVSLAKRMCKTSEPEKVEKNDDVKRAMQRRANPAYIRSSYMEAQVTFGEEIVTTEMIDAVEEGESEGEDGELSGEEESVQENGGEGDTVPLSVV